MFDDGVMNYLLLGWGLKVEERAGLMCKGGEDGNRDRRRNENKRIEGRGRVYKDECIVT